MTDKKHQRIALYSSLIALSLSLAACSKQEPAQNAATDNVATASEVAANANTDASSIKQYPNKEAWFGNLHVHTQWPFDAYINGAIATPDEACRWAKGEAILGGGDGTPLKIITPLDWYVVSDHAEYMGALPLMADPDSPANKHPLAADITGDDPAASFQAYTKILDGISSRNVDPILGDPELGKSIWKKIVDTADQHYQPGRFTTMAGYEWTANPNWKSLHPIVFFKDTKNVPEIPFSALNSDKPEALWQWMDEQREMGNDLLAIPHSGNASNGLMFPVGQSYGGSELNLEYAETRMRNEPAYEISQIKGTSETHPVLPPNDEFSSGGVAGVWAESNTREAIFAALKRKKTFATSGPRMKVRLFAGFEMPDVSLASPEGLPLSIQERAWSSPIWYTP